MYNDNGTVDSNQSKSSLPTANPGLSPVNSTPTFPFNNGPSGQPPQGNLSVNQNVQSSGPLSPPFTETADNAPPAIEDSELQEIKRNALQNLLPIVGKLDQSPEERFQTLLMVIQASDNRELINEAYETAAKIPDEGKRAQALLAIINEINFFTQQPVQS